MVHLDQPTKTLSAASSNKRKWDDLSEIKPWLFNPAPEASLAAFDLHPQTPLPLEWQRCLDIESGEIHFYNIRTKRRTNKDPRESHEVERPNLDLELNLQCGDDHNKNPRTKIKTLSLFTKDSWRQEEEEMVAAACKKCHMLVVLCKSSPACPNCKFMHPHESSSPASQQGHASANTIIR